MRRRRLLRFGFASALTAMALAPAFGAAVVDTQGEACTPPLHVRIMQLGFTAVDLPPTPSVPVQLEFVRSVNPGARSPKIDCDCPSPVSARAPPTITTA